MKATVASFAAFFATASAFMAPTPMRTAAPRAAKSGMSMSAKSASIPFMPQPEKLDGSMAGDVGFDPLGLSNINIDFSEVCTVVCTGSAVIGWHETCEHCSKVLKVESGAK